MTIGQQALKYGQPCTNCTSSDGVTIYEDHSHCYACNHQVWFNDDEKPQLTAATERKKTMLDMITGGEFRDLKDSQDEFFNRAIDKDVCEKYGVKVKDNSIIFPYYSFSRDYQRQKVRTKGAISKGGNWAGPSGADPTLFGSQLFEKGKTLTVVEGEFDALAAYQIMGKKWPVVSIRNGADRSGAGPSNEFKKNFDFFRNFDSVVICFDNDEIGRASAEACAKVLPIGKAKIMQMNKHKDANDYLMAGDQEEFMQEFWAAKPIMPQDIVFGTELRDRIIDKLYERKEKSKIQYPWENLNKLTYGIRLGEMVTVISGTGVGKSSVIGELVYHILTNTQEKIGLFMLEESVEMANLRLASLHASKPYHLPTTEWTEEELHEVFSNTIELCNEHHEPRLVSFDHFGSNSIDEMLYRVDHMVALGCKYIFLDHISIVVSDQSHGDERKALDEIATKLRTKVQEHNIALFIVSHLRRGTSKPHEEGGHTSLQDIRGTQAIAQLSDMVIGLERNGQAEDAMVRNTTHIRVLKNRLSGLTGLGCSLLYSIDSGRLHEIITQEEEEEDNGERVQEVSSTATPSSSDHSVSDGGDININRSIEEDGQDSSERVGSISA